MSSTVRDAAEAPMPATDLATGLSEDLAAELAARRAEFDREGFVVIPGALTPDEVGYYREALDRVYLEAEASGQIGSGTSMHQLSAVAHCPEAIGLTDHPATLPYVYSILGWNIHIYHSHLDVHPQLPAQRPFRFEWHQDGGRQNREIETDPRPRLSVKLAYWLSDVSEPGRGNFKVVPRSHVTNWIDGPPRRDVQWPDPPGAIEVTASPGDVVLFDRRLWHARSDNYSPITRKAMFFGYTYRWIAIRDTNEEIWSAGWADRITPVQRQLLGGLGGDGDHAWGHYPESTPLYGWLKERGLLDPGNPPLKPLAHSLAQPWPWFRPGLGRSQAGPLRTEAGQRAGARTRSSAASSSSGAPLCRRRSSRTSSSRAVALAAACVRAPRTASRSSSG
jgi:ectoine hydroxylase